MSYKDFEDEAEQRVAQRRDAKGRFMRKYPVKIVTKSCNCGCTTTKKSCKCGSVNDPERLIAKFEKLQVALNPKKDCKKAYEEAHNFLIGSGGMISKVMIKGTNRPFGYLVRIPSITNPNVVFLNFHKANGNTNINSYFQKLTAVVSTVVKGERYLANRAKYGWALEDIPFELYFKEMENVMHIDDGGVNVIKSEKPLYYLAGKSINDCERTGYMIDEDVMNYFNKFEKKAKDYYQENGKIKKFIALHVS